MFEILPKETTWSLALERKEWTANDPEWSAPLKYFATEWTKDIPHEGGVPHVVTLGLGLLAPGPPEKLIYPKE